MTGDFIPGLIDDKQLLRRTRAIDDKSRVVRIAKLTRDGNKAYVLVCHSGGKWRLRTDPIPIDELHTLNNSESFSLSKDELFSKSMISQKRSLACKPRGRRRSKAVRMAGWVD